MNLLANLGLCSLVSSLDVTFEASKLKTLWDTGGGGKKKSSKRERKKIK
jgi:hypothetical protein